MAKFPDLDSLIISDPVSETLVFQTRRSRFGTMGVEHRKAAQTYVKRNFTVKAERVVLSQAQTLYSFYLARLGGFEAFNYFTPLARTYTTPEYVGTGDAETKVYNLPAKGSTAYDVYIDGLKQTETTNYAIGIGSGADGADKLTLTAAPSLGARITYTFTGRLKIRGTFAEDNLTFETFLGRLVTVGLAIQGELNA